MIHKKDLISFRDFVPDDFNFVIATWLQGLYHGNDFFKMVEKEAYFNRYHEVLEKLIPLSKIKVAALSEDPDVILGYCVTSSHSPTLHWVFVKEAWRKIGIAKDLIPKNITHYSHFSTVGLSAFQKHQWQFNPFNL